jgi:hypothetical protein
VEEALKHGARVKTKGGKDRIILGMYPSIVDFAIAVKASAQILKLLAGAGADVNGPFLRSVRKGSPKILKTLLDLGADVNGTDGDGFCPLALLAERRIGIDQNMAFLTGAGADVNRRNSRGQTPLMQLFAKGNEFFSPESVFFAARSLVKNGADVNASDGTGHTPLMYTAWSRQNNAPSIMLLAEHGADVDASDSDGRTALFFAIANIANYTTGMVSALLRSGAGLKPALEGLSPQYCSEHILKRREKRLAKKELAFLALLIAIGLYPDTCGEIESAISRNRSEAISLLLKEPLRYIPAEETLSVMNRGKGHPLSIISADRKNIVFLVLEVFEDNPELAARFVSRRIGTQLETWIEDGVPGSRELMSRLAGHFAKTGKAASKSIAGDENTFPKILDMFF